MTLLCIMTLLLSHHKAFMYISSYHPFLTGYCCYHYLLLLLLLLVTDYVIHHLVIGENVMLEVATSDLVVGPTRLLFPRAAGGIGEVRAV